MRMNRTMQGWEVPWLWMGWLGIGLLTGNHLMYKCQFRLRWWQTVDSVGWWMCGFKSLCRPRFYLSAKLLCCRWTITQLATCRSRYVCLVLWCGILGCGSDQWQSRIVTVDGDVVNADDPGHCHWNETAINFKRTPNFWQAMIIYNKS